MPVFKLCAGSSVRIANELLDGSSGNRIPVGVRFYAPVQTIPGAQPASCTMGKIKSKVIPLEARCGPEGG